MFIKKVNILDLLFSRPTLHFNQEQGIKESEPRLEKGYRERTRDICIPYNFQAALSLAKIKPHAKEQKKKRKNHEP